LHQLRIFLRQFGIFLHQLRVEFHAS
jgi:hypothetical protein